MTRRRPGGGGCQRKPFPVTRRDRGGGCSTPLPVSPTPRVAIPHRYSARSRQSLCRQRDRHHRNPVSAPRALYPDYRQSLPAPWRGREEARNAPGGGGSRGREVFSDAQATGAVSPSTKTVHQETQRQGRGMFHPPPRQPHPQGVIPHRYSARESVTTVSVDPPRDPFPAPRALYPGLSSITARPLEGAGGGRGSGREAGVV